MRRRASLFAWAWAFALPAAAAEFNAAVTVAPGVDSANGASPYHVGAPVVPSRRSRQDLELRLAEGGFNAQGTLRWQAAEGRTPERHGVANQFYYDSEFAPGWGWTAGKKVMSWGVGFGFRPLDLVQRENRRGVNLPALVGTPLVAVERFTATDAWTLAWARPADGLANEDHRETSLALRWYRLAGGDDLHAVARVSQRRGLEAGAGATRVVGDEWSFHGAALYQGRYRKLMNPLADNGGLFATADPMAAREFRDGIKAVAGAQWTGESAIGLLAEAWYDADAYSRSEWRRLDALTARQRALAGIAPSPAILGNAGWSSQAYLAPNLLRENILLRASWDDRDGFKPYVEWLTTPRDRGQALTVGASFEGNRQRLSLGLRQFGGAADSAYAQAPFRRMAWVEWRLAIF
ncbi:MAG: hypothetical protein Q8O34_14050 [Rhodocyclaceae bacterium]|nr:hypothetical protein [Rhodocyclaceae bacterium]